MGCLDGAVSNLFDNVVSSLGMGATDALGITESDFPTAGNYIAETGPYSEGRGNLFNFIDMAADPTGVVHGGTQQLGAELGEDVMPAASVIAPIAGAVIGGPGGAAGGSGIYADLLRGATGNTQMGNMESGGSQDAMKNAGLSAVASWLFGEGSNYLGNAISGGGEAATAPTSPQGTESVFTSEAPQGNYYYENIPYDAEQAMNPTDWSDPAYYDEYWQAYADPLNKYYSGGGSFVPPAGAGGAGEIGMDSDYEQGDNLYAPGDYDYVGGNKGGKSMMDYLMSNPGKSAMTLLNIINSYNKANMQKDLSDAQQQSYQKYLNAINADDKTKATQYEAAKGSVSAEMDRMQKQLTNTMAARGIRGKGTAGKSGDLSLAKQKMLNDAYNKIYGTYNVPSTPGPTAYAPSGNQTLLSDATQYANYLYPLLSKGFDFLMA